LAEGENDAKRRSVQVRDEIQELTERGFGQKEKGFGDFGAFFFPLN